MHSHRFGIIHWPDGHFPHGRTAWRWHCTILNLQQRQENILGMGATVELRNVPAKHSINGKHQVSAGLRANRHEAKLKVQFVGFN